MGYQFGHSGGAVPLRLQLDETEKSAPCPACQRLDLEGTVTVRVPAAKHSGSVAATCSRGHMTFVNWSRESAEPAE